MAQLTVINRRLPGGRRGDWAVKKNGRVISEGHRTQRKAREVARRKARKGDRVVVQGVDGAFRENDAVRKNGRKRKRGRRRRRQPRAFKPGTKRFKFGDTNASKLLKGRKDLV